MSKYYSKKSKFNVYGMDSKNRSFSERRTSPKISKPSSVFNRNRNKIKGSSPFVSRKKKPKRSTAMIPKVKAEYTSPRKSRSILNLYDGVSPIIERKINTSHLDSSYHGVDEGRSQGDVNEEIVQVLDSFQNIEDDLLIGRSKYNDNKSKSYMTDFHTHEVTVERLEKRIRELTRDNLSEKERNMTLMRYKNNFEDLQKKWQLSRYKESKLESSLSDLRVKYEEEVERNKTTSQSYELLKDERDWITSQFEQKVEEVEDEVGLLLEKRHEAVLKSLREKYKHIIEVQRLEINSLKEKGQQQDQKMKVAQEELTKLRMGQKYDGSIQQTMEELEKTVESQRNSLKKYKAQYERLKFEKSNLVHRTIEEEEEKRKRHAEEEYKRSFSPNSRKTYNSSSRETKRVIDTLLKENRTLRNIQTSLEMDVQSQEELHELEIRKLEKVISDLQSDFSQQLRNMEIQNSKDLELQQTELDEKQKILMSQSVSLIDLKSKIQNYETEIISIRQESNEKEKSRAGLLKKVEDLEMSRSKVTDLLIRIEEREQKLSTKLEIFEKEKKKMEEIQNVKKKDYDSVVEKERMKIEEERFLLRKEYERKKSTFLYNHQKKNIDEVESSSLTAQEDQEIDLNFSLLNFRKNQMITKERESLDELKRRMSFDLVEEYQDKLKEWVDLERAKIRQRRSLLDSKFRELKEKQRKFDGLEMEIQERDGKSRMKEKSVEDMLQKNEGLFEMGKRIESQQNQIEELGLEKKELEKIVREKEMRIGEKEKEMMKLRVFKNDREEKLNKREMQSEEREKKQELKDIEIKSRYEQSEREMNGRQQELQEKEERLKEEIKSFEQKRKIRNTELEEKIKRLETKLEELQREHKLQKKEIIDLKLILEQKDSKIESISEKLKVGEKELEEVVKKGVEQKRIIDEMRTREKLKEEKEEEEEDEESDEGEESDEEDEEESETESDEEEE